MVNVPISHAEIIIREGGDTKVAERLGEDRNNVKAWRRVDSIPSAYWRRIVGEGISSYGELSAWAEHRKLAADQAKTSDEAA